MLATLHQMPSPSYLEEDPHAGAIAMNDVLDESTSMQASGLKTGQGEGDASPRVSQRVSVLETSFPPDATPVSAYPEQIDSNDGQDEHNQDIYEPVVNGEPEHADDNDGCDGHNDDMYEPINRRAKAAAALAALVASPRLNAVSSVGDALNSGRCGDICAVPVAGGAREGAFSHKPATETASRPHGRERSATLYAIPAEQGGFQQVLQGSASYELVAPGTEGTTPARVRGTLDPRWQVNQQGYVGKRHLNRGADGHAAATVDHSRPKRGIGRRKDRPPSVYNGFGESASSPSPISKKSVHLYVNDSDDESCT